MMALRNVYRIIFILGFAAIIGCGGKDEPAPQTDDGDGIFTASVNGGSFTSLKKEARSVHTKGYGGGDLYSMYVQGLDNTNRLIHFTIISKNEITVSTNALTVKSANSAYFIENQDTSSAKAWISPNFGNSDFEASNGTVSFTEITTSRAKGTFSFTAFESGGSTTREITSGTFDVPLKRQGF